MQGQVFLRPTSEIDSREWLLKTVTSSRLPSRKTSSGAFYMDIDATSLRMVYAMMRSTSTEIASQVQRMRDVDVELALVTADYLGLSELAAVMKAYVQDAKDHDVEVNELEKQLLSLKAENEKQLLSLKAENQKQLLSLKAENQKQLLSLKEEIIVLERL